MKKFRVGYYVEVEVEAINAGDAIHMADGAMGHQWWNRTFPYHVAAEAMGRWCYGLVRRIEQLYSHEVGE